MNFLKKIFDRITYPFTMFSIAKDEDKQIAEGYGISLKQYRKERESYERSLRKKK